MGTTVCRVEGTDRTRPEGNSRFASADEARYRDSQAADSPNEEDQR
jgi:hypothetical protein